MLAVISLELQGLFMRCTRSVRRVHALLVVCITNLLLGVILVPCIHNVNFSFSHPRMQMTLPPTRATEAYHQSSWAHNLTTHHHETQPPFPTADETHYLPPYH